LITAKSVIHEIAAILCFGFCFITILLALILKEFQMAGKFASRLHLESSQRIRQTEIQDAAMDAVKSSL
jgi:hypothetical protein